jgi:hypothetical protein
MNEMKEILLPGEPPQEDVQLTKAQMLLFAPVDKRAFGVAIGTTWALAIFALTAAELLLEPHPSINLGLLSHFFKGYDVTWPGAVIGAAWGFFSGFCAGWFTAFVRNLVLALSLFMLRTRAELDDSRDFLDHI